MLPRLKTLESEQAVVVAGTREQRRARFEEAADSVLREGLGVRFLDLSDVPDELTRSVLISRGVRSDPDLYIVDGAKIGDGDAQGLALALSLSVSRCLIGIDGDADRFAAQPELDCVRSKLAGIYVCPD